MSSYVDYDDDDADQEPIVDWSDPQPEGDFSHSGCSNGECGEC